VLLGIDLRRFIPYHGEGPATDDEVRRIRPNRALRVFMSMPSAYIIRKNKQANQNLLEVLLCLLERLKALDNGLKRRHYQKY
jgi:hypothetical protein